MQVRVINRADNQEDRQMSDSRIPDELIPPTANRRYVPRVDEAYEDEPGRGAFWAIVAIIAVLLVGGFVYYRSGPHVASTPSTPPVTTGAAPQSDPRPASPLPPAPQSDPRSASPLPPAPPERIRQ